MPNITITLSSSGSSVDKSVAPGTSLPQFLADALRLTNLDFGASTILVNEVKVPTNEAAATRFLNEGDEVYVGKTHDNG